MRTVGCKVFRRFIEEPRGMIKAWVLLALSSILLAACGGGGGGGSYQAPPPPPPSASLSYPTGVQTFTVGTAITPIIPTITGTLTSFTVSPTLPGGLGIDPNKGTISGTPTAIIGVGSYTVSATGSGGVTASASLSIAVNNVSPSNISYSASSFTFSAMVSSLTFTPKVSGGAVVSWSINPALPAGLYFRPTDGSISGVPTTPSASAAYVVTAQNTGGQSTATVNIAVDAPLMTLGHQSVIVGVRETATNLLSEDAAGDWILWDFAGGTAIANGSTGCQYFNRNCSLSFSSGSFAPGIDLAGSIAVIATTTGLEVHATSDGHTVSSIATSATWWKLATDGSYIAAGGSTGLFAWSPSGQLLFSLSGDYSQAAGFAAPGKILVAVGPAGQNVVQTVAVPSGTVTTGPPFNGKFASLFLDGGHLLTISGLTALVYSNDGSTQQASITPVPTDAAGLADPATIGGQGNWVWTFSGGTLSLYPATGGVNPAPAATYTFQAGAALYESGPTLVVLPPASTTVSVIDLSGAAPTRADHTAPGAIGYYDRFTLPYAAISASQWVLVGGSGVGVFDVLDGGSLAGTARYFGLGPVLSIAGGPGRFAVATGSGILYFNSGTLAQEGKIPFVASQMAISSDGTILVAWNNQPSSGLYPVEVYSLPAGNLIYTWTYPSPGGVIPDDVELSASGTVLGQVLSTLSGSGPPQFVQEASAPTGGPTIFSNTFGATGVEAPLLRISPDGTLIATSRLGSPVGGASPEVATNLFQNGNSLTVFPGLPVGWLDNSRLVVNVYKTVAGPDVVYAACSIYGANGVPTGGACALPFEVQQFQPVTSDTIYTPLTNQIVSVSTGTVGWTSGDASKSLLSALAGSHVIFVSGPNLLAQPY